MNMRGSLRSLVRLSSEIYLTVFVLFFRLGARQWPSSMHAEEHQGVGGVTLVEGILLFSVALLASAEVGYHLTMVELQGVFLTFPLYLINRYFLVVRGCGTSFENDFKNFRKEKRIALRSAAIAVVLVTWLIALFSADRYRHQILHVFAVPRFEST